MQDAKSPGMAASSSAPVLSNSPYAASLTGSRPKKPAKWTPPPGAFNNPDLPQFTMPGPGRYTPSHLSSSVKPRVTAARFGSEDRFKYLGPQTPLEETSSGMASGYCPQAVASPGPGYLPQYGLVHSASRQSAFSVERRDTSGIGPGTGASVAPGPGLYNPTEKMCSHRRNNTPGGAFLADDRHKYLGQVDADSGMVRQTYGPGPAYKPGNNLAIGAKTWDAASVKPRASTVAFGGRGPGTIRKPPSLKTESPGPGSYEMGTTMADLATLSSKPRAPGYGFGSSVRGDSTFVDSMKCYHGKVPIDMTNANKSDVSPGPGYHPSIEGVRAAKQKALFGTAKRTTPGLAPVAPFNLDPVPTYGQ
uniref:Uncharacterized protein n=1 Tax=Haptolina brevifila TaxID=156173 RepID=A0A7S2DJ32_9EUKA|mmetsp:Transcript_39494/g.78952  ORF Transcript_39494/g.78952 Transcript_39494/m.78952 type:complete len:362 (+) Transcript_39494:107-1192(+)